jgi:hypothetical protein
MAVAVSISIDTEEDDWGRYVFEGASTRNIAHLVELQELLGSHGARPTYLVNRPPLLDSGAVDVLGKLAATPGVEIGAHCHPWNTPPNTGEGVEHSMMFRMDAASNQAMIREITNRIQSELGVRPTTFRAGRWGWGRTVAEGLAAEGYRVDSSVSPLIDWRPFGGPDYTDAPSDAYRFHPARPFHPDPSGPLVELPTTVGFLRGDDARLGPLRARLERAVAHGFGLIGALDRLGVMARRWLSPEVTSGRSMIRLAENLVAHGRRRLDMTFHSCTLLPGATPFVRDASDRKRLLSDIRAFLRFADEAGFEFRTLGELGAEVPGATPSRS